MITPSDHTPAVSPDPEQNSAAPPEIVLRLAHSEICTALLYLSMAASLSMEASVQLGPVIGRILEQGLPQEQQFQLAAMPADSLGRA